MVDGVTTSTADTAPLFVNLINDLGRVVAVSPVTNGTYSFVVNPNTSYTLSLSTMEGVINEVAPAPSLPTGFSMLEKILASEIVTTE